MSAEGDEPSLAALAELARSPRIADRAFAASSIFMQHPAQDGAALSRLYEQIRQTARAQHADVRARIRAGRLELEPFIARLEQTPLELRDHLVEEILDIAYPPLQKPVLPREAVGYSPSGLAEILFVVAEAKLGPGKTFVDLGSGLGKVALLVSLLTGANAYGIELDPYLVAGAQAAAHSLSLTTPQFIAGDILSTPLPPADVFYMFIPWLRSAELVRRLKPLAAERKLLLFSQALDLRELPWLRRTDRASYWLELYESCSR